MSYYFNLTMFSLLPKYWQRHESIALATNLVVQAGHLSYFVPYSSHTIYANDRLFFCPPIFYVILDGPALNEWMNVRSLSEKLVHIYEKKRQPTTPRYESRHSPPVVVGAWSYKLSISRCHAYENPKRKRPMDTCTPTLHANYGLFSPVRSGPKWSKLVHGAVQSKCPQCPIATAQNGMNPVYSIYKYYSTTIHILLPCIVLFLLS